jgi:hypothetical protein
MDEAFPVPFSPTTARQRRSSSSGYSDSEHKTGCGGTGGVSLYVPVEDELNTTQKLLLYVKN